MQPGFPKNQTTTISILYDFLVPAVQAAVDGAMTATETKCCFYLAKVVLITNEWVSIDGKVYSALLKRELLHNGNHIFCEQLLAISGTLGNAELVLFKVVAVHATEHMVDLKVESMGALVDGRTMRASTYWAANWATYSTTIATSATTTRASSLARAMPGVVIVPAYVASVVPAIVKMPAIVDRLFFYFAYHAITTSSVGLDRKLADRSGAEQDILLD